MLERRKLYDVLGLIPNSRHEDITNSLTLLEQYESGKDSESEIYKENFSYLSNDNSRIPDGRSLSCATSIYPRILEIKSNPRGEKSHFPGIFGHNSINFWNSFSILKKRLIGIFWSIVSLDKDDPLYDYSTPLRDVTCFSRNNYRTNKVNAPSLQCDNFLSETLKVSVVAP